MPGKQHAVTITWLVLSGLPLAAQVHRLDWREPYNPDHFRFLKTAVGSRSVVQLGESIHLTDEFPRARLPIVRYLHEEMGFDVIAFEGSAVDAWLAQDRLYRSSEPTEKRVAEAQRLAWFTLWQTDAMKQVMSYIASTQATRRPLYLTSFDVQYGDSAAFHDDVRAWEELLKAVSAYATPAADRIDRWRQAFSPYFGCRTQAVAKSDAQRKAAERTLVEMQDWFASAAKAIHPEMHGQALRLVAESLRGTLELCSASATRPFGGETYQRVRDSLNAANAIAIRNTVSKSHRIILWAHHSHVHHNSSGQSIPSMGQHLLAALGDDLYTIGLFAGGGEAIDVDNENPAIKKLPPAGEYEIEDRLQSLAKFDYFLDFSSPSTALTSLQGASTGRLEVEAKRPFRLLQDFHAAIFIHEVSPPDPIAGSIRRSAPATPGTSSR